MSLLVSFLRPECKVRIPNKTLFLKSGARKENVSLPLGNCVMVDAKVQRAIVARVANDDVEPFEVEEDEDDDEDVAEPSSVARIHYTVYQTKKKKLISTWIYHNTALKNQHPSLSLSHLIVIKSICNDSVSRTFR